MVFIQRAQREGVETVLHVAVDMPHNPPVLADYHPTANAALLDLAKYIAQQLDPSGFPPEQLPAP